MSNTLLLNLIEEILGSSKSLRNGEVAFFCPFCSHHKKKLQVNLESHKFHCWVCDAKGQSIYALFRKLDVRSGHIERLFKIVGDRPKQYKSPHIDENFVLTLPSEFVPFLKESKDPMYTRAKKYMLERGLTDDDVVKYNIGYCLEGQYSGRLIVPSYDEDGRLNYFVGRSFMGDSYKYKNPPISKDIIGFGLFVDWRDPIVLVEGVLDAMSIRRNTIPMFGKFLSKELKKKIVSEKVKEIYIVLDGDAKNNALRIAKQYIDNGLTVYVVDVGEEDPSSLGFIKITHLIRKTEPLDFSSLILQKLELDDVHGNTS